MQDTRSSLNSGDACFLIQLFALVFQYRRDRCRPNRAHATSLLVYAAPKDPPIPIRQESARLLASLSQKCNSLPLENFGAWLKACFATPKVPTPPWRGIRSCCESEIRCQSWRSLIPKQQRMRSWERGVW